MRVELGKALARRAATLPVSRLNARLDMGGRELVDFLEAEAPPETMTSLIRALAAVVILAGFHSLLALASVGGAFVVMLVIYALAHGRFFFTSTAP